MKKIGIFICNYNKCEYVLNCVNSLIEQTCKDVDIYVVDNASTDDSVAKLKDRFHNQIEIIEHTENLGGSGGFCTGLRIGLSKNYEYIMLIDNDVIVDQNTVQTMLNYMENHKDVGILGPLILQMADRERIQDFGGSIAKNYTMKGNYYNELVSEANLPAEMECEYISTCTAMARVEAIKKFGLMPEDNFIYYDDVEWSKKCQIAGYKTVAISTCKVWHNLTGSDRYSTFVQYYYVRNSLHYFVKYLEEERVNEYVDYMLSEVFAKMFGFKYKGMIENFENIFYAFDDFLHNVRGKADDYKITKTQKRNTPFENIIKDKKKIKIFFMDNPLHEDALGNYYVLYYIVSVICNKNLQDKIYISLKDCKVNKEEFETNLKHIFGSIQSNFKVPEICIDESEQEFDVVLKMCEHVKMVEEYISDYVYVDKYCNCIAGEADYKYFSSASEIEKFFVDMYKPLMMKTVKELRNT